MRKNSVVLQDALVTASPEWIEEQPHEVQVAYFKHAYEYFVDKFGEENIISASTNTESLTRRPMATAEERHSHRFDYPRPCISILQEKTGHELCTASGISP